MRFILIKIKYGLVREIATDVEDWEYKSNQRVLAWAYHLIWEVGLWSMKDRKRFRFISHWEIWVSKEKENEMRNKTDWKRNWDGKQKRSNTEILRYALIQEDSKPLQIKYRPVISEKNRPSSRE